MKHKHIILHRWNQVMSWVMMVVLLASAAHCYGDGPICQGSTPCSPAYSRPQPGQSVNPWSRTALGENSRPLTSVSGYGFPGSAIYDPCSPFYKVLVSSPSHRSLIWQTMPPYCQSALMSGYHPLFQNPVLRVQGLATQQTLSPANHLQLPRTRPVG